MISPGRFLCGLITGEPIVDPAFLCWFVIHQQWKVEQLLTVETRTLLRESIRRTHLSFNLGGWTSLSRFQGYHIFNHLFLLLFLLFRWLKIKWYPHAALWLFPSAGQTYMWMERRSLARRLTIQPHVSFLGWRMVSSLSLFQFFITIRPFQGKIMTEN